MKYKGLTNLKYKDLENLNYLFGNYLDIPQWVFKKETKYDRN